ncbi:MAG: hypothetical protein ABIP39_04345 [Polyangiaceae bacterium]
MTIVDSNSHQALEQKREVTRSRLFGKIDVLDRRRRSLTDVGAQVKTYASRFAFGAAAISVAVIATLAFFALRPDANPEPPPKRSLLKDSLRRAAIGLVIFAVNQLGKRTVRRFIGEYPEGGRIGVTD